MIFCGYDTAPQDVKAQINAFVLCALTDFKDCVAGIYLHGSMALNCYVAGRGDIDLLIVTNRAPSVAEKLAFAKDVVGLHKKPAPLELSVLTMEQLHPWRHPAPCAYHFSDFWFSRTKARLSGETSELYVLDCDFTDADIACHARIARESGVTLYGLPAANVFPEVPEKDFIDSLTNDIDDYDFEAYGADSFASNILILARVLTYFEQKRVLTKYAAGEWAIQNLPERFRSIFSSSLATHYEGTPYPQSDRADLADLREYLISRIKRHMQSIS